MASRALRAEPVAGDRDGDGAWAAPLRDDELTALALAADPSAPLDPDAVPLDVFLADAAPLPSWYMAPVMARHAGRWRRGVVLGLVGSFALIEAFGLCSTYGQFPFH
ncbi:MAG TPA: hypothetical protein VLZ77_02220 [Acidimicrobiales bacterium]|nr:hypothetical protein [Acidimicrobiales bacterium]